jgi:hypothetical protein
MSWRTFDPWNRFYRFAAPIHAMASISTRISGVARLRTSTSVEQGESPVKNSWRARRTSAFWLMLMT